MFLRTSLSEIHLNSMVSFLKRSVLNICVWCRPWPSGFGSGAHLFTPTACLFLCKQGSALSSEHCSGLHTGSSTAIFAKICAFEACTVLTGGLSWAFLHRGPSCDLDPEPWLFPPFVLWSTCLAAWETEAWRQVPYTTQWQKSRKWGLPDFFHIHCK